MSNDTELQNLKEYINRLEGRIRNLEHWKERTENILFLKGITEGFKSADEHEKSLLNKRREAIQNVNQRTK